MRFPPDARLHQTSLTTLQSPHLILVPRTVAFMQRHVTLLVFPVHNSFASPSQNASCWHYNNHSNFVDLSPVTPSPISHLPDINLVRLFPTRFSRPFLYGSIHDVLFVSFLYTLLPIHSFSIRFISDSSPSFLLVLSGLPWERNPQNP